jgi:prefoldin subunit 5
MAAQRYTVKKVYQKLQQLTKKVDQMAGELDALKTAVARVMTSVIAAIAKLQLGGGVDPAALTALTTQLNATADSLDTAVTPPVVTP